LIEILFPIANSDASYRVQVRNVILKKPWGTETFLDKIKESKVFAISSLKRNKRIREANDKLEHNLRFPEKVTEAQILRGVTELKKRKTIHDKILLVQLCIGSRFTEVLFISDISVSNLPEKPAHTYIRVYGVGKEQRESRRKNLAVLKAKRRKISEYKHDDDEEEVVFDEDDADALEEDNQVSDYEPKEIIKPVLFDVSPMEISDLVKEIRVELRKKVSWYDTITREDFNLLQKLANLYLQKAVDRVFELFGYRHTHLMRRLYACWSYETWGKTDMAQLGWYKAVLGHTSSNTSRAYTTLIVLPIVQAGNKNLETLVGQVITQQKMASEQVAVLQEEIKQLHTFNNPPIAAEGEANFWLGSNWVTVQKAPNEKVENPEARVGEWAAKLEQAGVEVTKSNLREVGFGSRIINDWWLAKPS
jgi:integrase